MHKRTYVRSSSYQRNNQKYFSFDVISSKWQKDFIFLFFFIFLICARCFVFKFQCHLHGSFQIFFSFWVGPHFSPPPPPYIRCSRIWGKNCHWSIKNSFFLSFVEKCVDPALTVHRKMYGIDKKCISRFFFFLCFVCVCVCVCVSPPTQSPYISL
jgi:hypothetical protein